MKIEMKVNGTPVDIELTEDSKKKLEKALSRPADVRDRVKTFADACKELGLDVEGEIPWIEPCNDRHRGTNAMSKLQIIAEALNESWKPDWDDSNQYKWFPYFRPGSGFCFSRTGYDYTYTCAAVGSRLCFKTEELAEYAGKQFEELYKELLTISE